MIKSIKDIAKKAEKHGKKKMVVARAEDLHTIQAVNDAVEAGLVDAILVGDKSEIESICKAEFIEPCNFKILHETDPVKCVSSAVKLVAEKKADVLMKGLVSTDLYMSGILNKESGLVPPKGILSHITVMKLPKYHKLLVVSDVAIIPSPDLIQKQIIIKYLVKTANALGLKQPKVACIAPSEQVLVSLESSTDAAILSKMGDRGVFGDAFVDGPLALDVALFREVVEIKEMSGSVVAGDADCLLFPNLDSANTFFKAATQLCDAELACMVAGTTAPCVLTSRGDSRETKFNSIALACLSAN